jgi:hypothetical protein
MLQDEDNIEDFSREVSVPFDPNPAVMEANAWRICCEEFESDELTQVIAVQQRTKRPNASGTVKWICKIRAEKEKPNVNDN